MSRWPYSGWQLATFAVETDFIDSQQLAKAVARWPDQPEHSLTDLLLEQQSLQPQDLALLATLWQERQRISNDSTVPGDFPEPSDFPAPSDFPEPSDFSAMGEETSPEAESLLHWTDPAYSADRDRFQFEAPIADGGLGTVFSARDKQLNRRVAIKEIHPRLLHDPFVRERFLREAELTGALEHPAIVPIYCVGYRSSGTPFYAMRLIEGNNLREIVETHHQSPEEGRRFSGTAFHRLLNTFVIVCQAVDFAHARNVVHRDIKPANIIVGQHGESMLVDWGLAKRTAVRDVRVDQALSSTAKHTDAGQGVEVREENDLTVDGLALGTPAYMSPEQAAGKRAEIGSAADIFSLGATLYFLLTGSAPYVAQSAGDVIAKAAQGKFAPPNQLRPDVPLALQSICLKAMAYQPTDRYATAKQLAEDIERWLADEPVSVHSDSLSQRLWRIARRNKRLTQLAIASTGLLAIITTFFSFLLNEQKKIARGETQIARELQIEKTGLAERERLAKQEAMQQNKLAIETLRSVITNMQRKLGAIPPAKQVREELLTVALQGLSKVSVSMETRVDVDRDAIVANTDLGQLYLLFGSSVPGSATDAALKHFEKARDISAQLVTLQPNDVQAYRDLSISWEHIGDAHLELGNFDAAQQAFDFALQASQDLAKAHPEDSKVERDLGFGWEKLGGRAVLHRRHCDGDGA